MIERLVSENEIIIDTALSGGPGGQNVNKTETKVILHWSVGASNGFTEEEKHKIRSSLYSRINKEDEVVIQVATERSQYQNRQLAVDLLNTLVTEAMRPVKRRVPTRPKRSAKEERLSDKKARSETKAGRKSVQE